MMKWTLFLSVVMATGAWAATTYTFSSTNYGTLTNFTSCTSGPCANFSTSMTITGSFTLATALPPNRTGGGDLTSQLTAFSFSDGINTYASTDANVRVYQFGVNTDSAGQISVASVLVERWQTGSSPHAAGDRVSTLNLNGPSINQANHNYRCTSVGGGTSSGVSDVCLLANPDNSSASASTNQGTWSGGTTSSPPPSTPSAVPLPPSLIFGVTGLLGAGGYQARRKLATLLAYNSKSPFRR